MDKDTRRILIHAGILLLLTVPFWFFGIDLKLESSLYSGNRVFTLADNPLFTALYKYGTIPALLLSVTAILVFTLGFAYKKLAAYRKQTLLMILAMLIGPGLIINVILKNYTGRPRPREVAEFGGNWKYRQPLEFGKPGRGFSFPCGHCSTGFVFYALYLIYRKKDRFRATAALSGSLIYGGLMGLARMAQGAHFASDVLWAGGITILTAEILHYKVVRTDEPGGSLQKAGIKNRAAVFASAAALLIAMSAFFLFATPFYRAREHGFNPSPSYAFSIVTSAGEIKFADSASAGVVNLEASGFGLPMSDCEDSISSFPENVIYNVSKKGFFSEFNASVNVRMPVKSVAALTVKNGDGRVEYTSSAGLKSADIYTGSGDIVFEPAMAGPGNITLETKNGSIKITLPAGMKLSDGARITAKAGHGEIVLVNKSAYYADMMKDMDKINGSKYISLAPKSNKGAALELTADKITLEK